MTPALNKLSVAELGSIVSRHVRLERRGRDFWAQCFFHKEKTPSFHLFQGRDGRGRFHCFSCGIDGDSIDFLRLVERRSYREAAGTAIPDPTLARERERQRQQEAAWHWLRDRNPDLPDEARHFLDLEGWRP